MEVIEDRSFRRRIQPDLVAFDVHEEPALIVEVKGVTPVPESVSQLLSYLEAVDPTIPFGMLVDPENIRIYKGGIECPVATIPTADVLRHYATAEFRRPASSSLLTTVVEAWLSDLDTHWHSESPPAAATISGIGLAQRLSKGTVEREVSLACHPLC